MWDWMTSISRNFDTNDINAATVASTQPSTANSGSSPLAPKFDRNNSPNYSQIQKAINDGRWLGQNFKAMAGSYAFSNVRARPSFHGYGSHMPKDVTLRTALPNNRLDMTVVLNVSGHDFKTLPNRQDLLNDRAADNSYNIRVTHPSGKVETMSDIDAKGELFTVQDISIDMTPGTTVIESWPNGSAGVAGYVEGRRLLIDYQPPMMNSGANS